MSRQRPTTSRPPDLAPTLALVRERSVGRLDEAQVEILRQANESWPPAPAGCRDCLGIAS